MPISVYSRYETTYVVCDYTCYGRGLTYPRFKIHKFHPQMHMHYRPLSLLNFTPPTHTTYPLGFTHGRSCWTRGSLQQLRRGHMRAPRPEDKCVSYAGDGCGHRTGYMYCMCPLPKYSFPLAAYVCIRRPLASILVFLGSKSFWYAKPTYG